MMQFLRSKRVMKILFFLKCKNIASVWQFKINGGSKCRINHLLLEPHMMQFLRSKRVMKILFFLISIESSILWLINFQRKLCFCRKEPLMNKSSEKGFKVLLLSLKCLNIGFFQCSVYSFS